MQPETPRPRRQLFIDGTWTDAGDGASFPTYDPTLGQPIADLAQASSADVDRAVRAARRRFDTADWSATSSTRDRAAILLDVARRIRADLERLAQLETRDSGKLLADSRDDIAEAAFQFEYYAGCALQMSGSVPSVPGAAMSIVLTEPVGVVGLITPWNYPLLMATQKVAPALAAGCTVVLKPAEQSSLTAIELAHILAEAGLPDGVFNLVTGTGTEAGAALVEHPEVDKISFTGSTAVGMGIARVAADRVARVGLELGGKSANIVLPDADLDAAFEGSARGVFFNMGQVCSAGSRVLVHRSIYDRSLEVMAQHAAAVRLGNPADEAVTMGPLVSSLQRERVERYLAVGMHDDAARLVYAGDRPTDPELAGGYFVPPVIFADVDNDMTIAREEIFGPVMAVIPFDDLDQAVAIANDSAYGLAAAVWTRDIATSLNVAKRLRAGTVWINDSQPAPSEVPWGGFKRSGLGRELGQAGFDAFCETKSVYINLT